jgi:AAA family ATP:ADP antiporter
MAAVLVVGVFAMYLFRWMHTNVLNDKKFFDPEENAAPKKKKKEKPSMGESFKIIFTSSELLFIALLIMAYGVTINLIEVQWKHQLKMFYAGDKNGYNAFMGGFSFVTGVFTILFGLFIGSSILRKVSWFSAAIITPVAILIGGSAFFLFIISQDLMAPVLAFFSTTPVAAATFVGAAIVIISKSVKYTLFDPTKEMAYIPLDEELKSKGKAAVDVIGGRLGKAAGGWVQMALIAVFSTKDIVVIAPAAFLAFGLVAVGWLYAVKGLSFKVAAAVERKRLQAQAA